jgi:hypothetical protein
MPSQTLALDWHKTDRDILAGASSELSGSSVTKELLSLAQETGSNRLKYVSVHRGWIRDSTIS